MELLTSFNIKNTADNIEVMPKACNTLNRYYKSGISPLGAAKPHSVAPLFDADISRAISLLSRFNNAVFISESQNQGEPGILIETAHRFCHDKSGQNLRKAFQLDAKQFIKASGDQPEAFFNELFSALEQDKDNLLLVITSLEEFAADAQLLKLLQNVIKKGSVLILGMVSLDGFRQLEKNPDIAGYLEFVLVQKSRAGQKRNKSVLIIGATSLLGSAVYELFSREYKLVRGTGFSKAGLLGFDRLDVNSEEEIRKYFSDYPGFDIVVYVSGEADADAAEKERGRAKALNADAVSLIAKYAKNCKFVYISSEYVFDGSKGPYGSYSKAEPLNYYGQSKLEGEKNSLKYFPGALVVRLGALYGYNGPHDKKTSVTKLIAALDMPEPLKADNVQVKHPILLEDAASTILKLLDYAAAGIYQTNGPEGLNKKEMAEKIAAVREQLYGCKFTYPVAGVEQAAIAAKPLNTHMVNVDTPRPFDEGIRFMLLKMKSTQKER